MCDFEHTRFCTPDDGMMNRFFLLSQDVRRHGNYSKILTFIFQAPPDINPFMCARQRQIQWWRILSKSIEWYILYLVMC
jgi:hypothetical protein